MKPGYYILTDKSVRCDPGKPLREVEAIAAKKLAGKAKRVEILWVPA